MEDNDGVGGEKMHIYGGGSLLLRIPRNEKKKKEMERNTFWLSLCVFLSLSTAHVPQMQSPDPNLIETPP